MAHTLEQLQEQLRVKEQKLADDTATIETLKAEISAMEDAKEDEKSDEGDESN